MSKDDREWLEAALKEYTFNDTDRLTELVNQLKAWGAQPTIASADAAATSEEAKAQEAM